MSSGAHQRAVVVGAFKTGAFLRAALRSSPRLRGTQCGFCWPWGYFLTAAKALGIVWSCRPSALASFKPRRSEPALISRCSFFFFIFF